jgi:hypothetical protein
MPQNKVVVQFKDSKIMKGNTSDFFPNKTQFHLTTLSGEMENIDVEQLKAIFFVKESEGNESRSNKKCKICINICHRSQVHRFRVQRFEVQCKS